MKRTSFTLVACLATFMAVGATANAQQGGPPPGGRRMGGMGMGGGQMMQQMEQQLFKDVNLTDVQKKQIDSIRKANRPTQEQMKAQGEAMRAARESHDTAAMKAAGEKMRANQEATEKAIEAVLTPEQLTQYNKNKADMRAKMEERMKDRGARGGRRGGGDAPPPPPPASE